MKVIGLTGGIGSGKSTVAKIFISLGVPVFNSDESGKNVLASDAEAISAIKKLLGDEVYENGAPNRRLIASMVFNDDDLLTALNNIIHPAVARETANWVEKNQSSCTYGLKEAAILFESGAYKSCDAVISVLAPESLRIDRVMNRDGVDESQVKSRIRKQWSDEERASKSDFTILNDGKASLIEQVLELHNQLLDER
ncbi:MAG: dephospho-CoA kinase [Salibacteraceae bacterium]